MNKYLKYSIIAAGVLTPFIIQVFLRAEFSDVVVLLMPGFIVAIFLQLYDLNMTFRSAKNARVRVGKQDLEEDMNAISKALRTIDRSEDDIFATTAVSVVRQARQQFEKMANGEIDVQHDVELSHLPTDLMREVQVNVSATLLWREDTLRKGRRESYNAAMVEAINSRNVTVQRLFILPDTESIDQRAIGRIREDIELGVEVKVISEETWGRNGDRPVDFGIWDSKKAWIYRTMNDGHRTAFVTNRAVDVENYEKIFRAKWIDGKSPQV